MATVLIFPNNRRKSPSDGGHLGLFFVLVLSMDRLSYSVHNLERNVQIYASFMLADLALILLSNAPTCLHHDLLKTVLILSLISHP